MKTRFDIGEKVYCVGYKSGMYMQSYPKIFQGTITGIDINDLSKITYHVKYNEINDFHDSKERVSTIEEQNIFKEKKEVEKYLNQFLEDHIVKVREHVNLELENL